MFGSFRLQIGACFVFALVTILAMVFARFNPNDLPYADARVYLLIAHLWIDQGVFVNGVGTLLSEPVKPGMFVAPLYPAFLAAVMKLDPSFANSISCLVESGYQPGCPISFRTPLILQSILAACSIAFVFAAAAQCTRSLRIGWFAATFALASREITFYAGQFLTETLFITVSAALVLVLPQAIKSGRMVPWLLTGALFALAALTRPSFVYPLYILVFGLTVAGMHAPFRGRSWPAIAPLVVGAFIVLLPWLLRNWLVMDNFAITAGYDSYTLVERAAYNLMSWKEWFVAWIYWLPDFGDNVAMALFPRELTIRLGWDDPTTFYQIGKNSLRAEMIAAVGGDENAMGYLMRTQILPNIGWHALVSLPLAMRGIWVGGYWSVVALPLAIWGVWITAQTRRLELAAPLAVAVALLGLHAFASVNVVRYNVPAIPALTVLSSVAVARICENLKSRFAR